MDLAGMRGILLEIPGDPVVKAHAKSQQQVCFLNSLVDKGFTVHAHHAHVERVTGRETANAEQGQRNGGVGPFGEFQQLAHGAAHQHTLSRQDHRPFGSMDQIHGFAHCAAGGWLFCL
jgi:hypothetical protein